MYWSIASSTVARVIRVGSADFFAGGSISLA
jgi:hypothetical protein